MRKPLLEATDGLGCLSVVAGLTYTKLQKCKIKTIYHISAGSCWLHQF